MKLAIFFKKGHLWELFIVVAPVIVLLGIHFLNGWLFSDGSNDGWLGFWGGYLGALLGLYGIRIQIRSEQNDKIKNARPEWYLSYRSALAPMEKIYVNLVQPKVLSGISIDAFGTHVLTFESKYYYDNQDFIAISNANQKTAFNIKILIKSVVKDAKTIQAFAELNADGKKTADERTEFFDDILNWSTIEEGVQIPRADINGLDMLFLTYEKYHDYDNYVTEINMFYQTELGEEILATFGSEIDDDVPQLKNKPQINYRKTAEQIEEYDKKMMCFNSVYQNTTSFIVDAVGKERFNIEKNTTESSSNGWKIIVGDK